MWLMSEDYTRMVDIKTGKTLSLARQKENAKYNSSAGWVIYVAYAQNGEVKYMVHKKFESLDDGKNYMAQLCTKLNDADYPKEKTLKVFLYKKE